MTTSGYATERETTEGRVFTVTGGDWDTITGSIDPLSNEKIVVNMGPQHPSTHGVLRLVLELEGETVTECRPVVGYLHTGIEKNLEYRNWTQGTTFVTRMDYLSPMFNEAALLPRGGEAARHRRPDHRAGQHDPGADDGAQPDRLAPGLAGHHRHGARRDLDDAVRLPRARVHPRHLRGDLRPADEPRVHPPRRGRAGHPGRRRSARSATSSSTCRRSSRSTRRCSPARSSGRSARRVSRCST